MLLIAITFSAHALNTRRIARNIAILGSTTGKWTQFSENEELNVKNLLQHLTRSPAGKELIHAAAIRAGEQGKTIYDVIKQGPGSLTDTTLIRRFSISKPDEISYETKSVVYVNDDHGFMDAVLDLAHELTHFVYRKSFNPYNLNFNLEEFIKNTIESKGGEAHAFVNECRVLQELFPSKLSQRHNCMAIYNELEGTFSLKIASREFYRMGEYYPKFVNSLGQHDLLQSFPHASNEKAAFISSAYGLPYPIAAYEEYMSVLKRVCVNDQKRLIYMRNKEQGRSPASEIMKVQKKFDSKCSGVL